MKKTTLYLPDELKAGLKRHAMERGVSEAVVVREALAGLIETAERPLPRLPLTGEALGDPSLAERVDACRRS